MIFSYVFIVISIIWLLSEILLARLRTSARTEQSQKLDKGSFKFLWIVIALSVTAEVLFGVYGIGLIRQHARIISLCGVVLIVIGLLIRWIAILSLKKYFTVDVSIQKNHQLKTDGIYRYIRHPAYLGSLLSFLGLGLAFSNWLSTIVIFVPILAVFLLRVRVEEAVMMDFLGEEYQKYCKKTKRLIPKIY